MSNLRDRLKKLADKPPEPVRAPAACRLRETLHKPGAQVSSTALAMLGGSGERLLFLDTETTGLSRGAGTLAFMVGIGKVESGILHVRQYYLTDYDQEEDMLARVLEELSSCDTLVTYNGKSFDIPLLQNRLVLARINPAVLKLAHIDLLHAARRVYKRRLQKCTLGDMESRVLGILRNGDLPGAEAPERWFSYLKTGNISLLDDVLYHNEQDIVTLSHLLSRLAQAYMSPEQLSHALDIYSVGRAMEAMGESKRAEFCYRQAGPSGEALYALARIYRRGGDTNQAVQALTRAASMGGRDSIPAMVALAKLLEHRLRDYAGALHWTDKALTLCAAQEIGPLMHRRKRLRQKIKGDHSS